MNPRATVAFVLSGTLGCGVSEVTRNRAERIEAKASEKAQQLGARINEGVDKALQRDTYSFKLSDALVKRGLQVTRADRIKDGRLKQGRKGITFYTIFNERFAGSVELRVLDRESREVGRAYLRLQGAKGSATWVNVALDPHTPMEAVETVELR